ncbi:lysoplasmalogenase [Dyadobacter psychrotolerans]|uniref:Lysoplasmalogenase n=1 Tax=Dyadobacter psychrotolerans TaxID=2541721 RepID=A0A4R5DY85_9BACT|nr:lysoplasmalogenase [Dyadobacter psychrotolerans]TDE17440.1 lysoplasmalogenase [Dyadobacter psychrotolerans]
MKSQHLFAASYIFITLLEITADITGHYWLVYVTKPMILILLMFYAQLVPDQRKPGNRKFFLPALFFALLGDILLMIKETDLFIPGLAAFLIMQILYCISFISDIRPPLSFASIWSKIPFIVFALALYLILLPTLPDLIMKVSVAVYAYSIATMTWLAWLRKTSVSASSFYMVFAGALLFMISDSCIAIHRFLIPIPLNTVWVMGTYAAAQYFIMMGYLKTKQAGD